MSDLSERNGLAYRATSLYRTSSGLETTEISFASMKLDVLLDPFTICLLCAIGVMVISQYLANLIHRF